MKNTSALIGFSALAIFAIVNFAAAATTISTNIQTDGTLNLATTTSSTAGVINKGGSRFLHDYVDPASDGHNLFIGMGAGNFSISIGANPTYFGSYNLGIGESALRATTNGFSNTVVGYLSGSSLTTGNNNTAIGNSAFKSDVAGTNNVAIGTQSMQNVTAAVNNNVAVGPYTLITAADGGNTAIGYNAGGNVASAFQNVALGANALTTDTTGSNNTALGTNADVASNNLTNATAIGYSAIVGASNSLVLGGTGANAVKVGIGTTTPATRLQISSGASATTTVTIGELGLTTSKGCVNINRSDGGAASFYVNAAGTLVVETNYCK